MRKRVLTALALAPVLLASCLVRTPYPLFLVCILAVTIGFWELRTMLGQPKALPVVTLLSVAGPFFATEVQSNRDPIQILLYSCLFWVAGVFFLVLGIRKKRISTAGVDMAGLWISTPATCILMLHKLGPDSRFLRSLNLDLFSTFTYHQFILLILLPLWAGDIFAYLVGVRFGKHLLAPKLSPKKSWEGAIANLIACVVVSVCLLPVIQDKNRLPLHIVCGVAVGILGQAGDLFESWIKRNYGVKDSGTILPGHGGVLDRIDSFLFAAPAVSIILVIAFA